tara:strand:- start:11322 stop:11507 length:186 start_codon:yes stop_codon:yes gene_type:complete
MDVKDIRIDNLKETISIMKDTIHVQTEYVEQLNEIINKQRAQIQKLENYDKNRNNIEDTTP